MAYNDLKVTLTSASPILTIPFLNTVNSSNLNVITVTPTSQLNYPCNVWVSPASGASVVVTTSFDGIHQTQWTPGAVTVPANAAFASCPGTITFNLQSGTSCVCGIT